MTDQPSDKNSSLSAETLLTQGEKLIVQDIEPYRVNESDIIQSLLANNDVANMSFFAFPIIGIIALLGRKRNSLMFNLTQAIVYQSIGIILSFILWIIWAIIAGGILLIFRSENPHSDSDQLFWPILVLGAFPALFSVGWIAYAMLYIADVNPFVEKTNGFFVYPKITVWLDRKLEERNVRSLRKKGDRLGEATFMFVKGLRNLGQEKHEKALEYFHTAIQIYRSLDDKKRVMASLAILSAFQAIKPSVRLETLHLLAPMLDEAGDYESYQEVLNLLKEIIYEEKDNQELLDWLNAVIVEHPDDPILLFSRANILELRRQFDQAFSDATRAVEVQPKNPAFLFTLGIILENQNRPKDAIEIFSRAIALDTEFAALYRHRATVYLEINRVEDATTDTERAVQLDPRSAYTRAQQAFLFLAKGEFTKAERYFQIAISQEDRARWQFGLALAKLGIGDKESAYQILSINREKAEDIDLDFARRWLNHIAAWSSLTKEEILIFAFE